MLAKNNPIFEEAAAATYRCISDDEIRRQIIAREDYQMTMATMNHLVEQAAAEAADASAKAAEAKAEAADASARAAEAKAEAAEAKAEATAKAKALADKEKENTALLAKLAEYEQKYGCLEDSTTAE